MRSRSSRFFVVLLHLIGVPEHLQFDGIRGVQPWPVVMETLSHIESTTSVTATASATTKEAEPVWLQNSDGRCIGPQGSLTADCGDATLWLPIPQTLKKRKRARMGLWAVDEEPIDKEEVDVALQKQYHGLVFYLVDRDIHQIIQKTGQHRKNPLAFSWWKDLVMVAFGRNKKQHRHDYGPLECLTHDSATRTISVQTCDAQQHKIPKAAALPSWGWRLQQQQQQQYATTTFSLKPATKDASDNKDNVCAVATAATYAVAANHVKDKSDFSLSRSLSSSSSYARLALSSCDSGGGGGSFVETRAVQLSLVRYRPAPASETTLAMMAAGAATASSQSLGGPQQPRIQPSPTKQQQQCQQQEEQDDFPLENATRRRPNPPSFLTQKRDLAHQAAQLDVVRNHKKTRGIITNLHFTSPALVTNSFCQHQFGSSPSSASSAQKHKHRHNKQSATVGDDGDAALQERKRKRALAHPEATDAAAISSSSFSSLSASPGSSKTTVSSSSPPPTSTQLQQQQPRKRARIPVHPYIAASQNEIWTDPQTGLRYPTDLSKYLGHDRKERGRQTMVGVGQYRKAGFIKVYGIALYVSKRDVLADAFFEAYAGMSADELRQRPEFLEHLRLHPQNFERSLFIQTNMQLAAETIRGSLKADWTMLTDEAKELIMTSSLEPQPMSDYTLQVLADKANNPTQCSCVTDTSSVNISSDPSCCARGTELVFTWKRNGDVECRLNRRMVAVFPRPDIGEGIFFEYLRVDDPISPEFRDHAVDGFPFLLAPLAMDVSHAVPPPSKIQQQQPEPQQPKAFHQVWSEFAASASSTAQRAMTDASHHVQQAARSLGDSVRTAADEFGKDMERRRELLWKRASEDLPLLMIQMRRDPVQTVKDLWSPPPPPPPPPALVQDDEFSAGNLNHLLRYRQVTKWLRERGMYAPYDEIGPMTIHPTMNMTQKFFLFLVHLYLLLLFLASFPGSTTRFIRCSMRTEPFRRMSYSGDSECRSEVGSEFGDEYDADEYFSEHSNHDVAAPRRPDPVVYSNSQNNRKSDTEISRFGSLRAAKLHFSPRYVRGVKLALSRSHASADQLHFEGEGGGEGSSSADNSSPAVFSPPLKQQSLSYFL